MSDPKYELNEIIVEMGSIIDSLNRLADSMEKLEPFLRSPRPAPSREMLAELERNKARIEALGLTLKEVFSIAGIHRTLWHGWVSGLSSPSTKHWERLMATLAELEAKTIEPETKTSAGQAPNPLGSSRATPWRYPRPSSEQWYKDAWGKDE